MTQSKTLKEWAESFCAHWNENGSLGLKDGEEVPHEAWVKLRDLAGSDRGLREAAEYHMNQTAPC